MTTTTTTNNMKLSSITIGGKKLPPRTIVYGVDGVGKSTFASEEIL